MDLDIRSGKAVKNIVFSFLLKGGSILVSLFIVPITLDYLNPYEYGIWLTLSSVLSWIYIFDIGLGNGLRNKLTEALAVDDLKLAKIYVSTAFFYMAVIVLIFYFLYLSLHYWIDWYSILNVDAMKVPDLNSIIILVLSFFCVGFLFKLVGNVYMAYQVPAVNDLLVFLGNLFSLLIIFVCSKITAGSLKTVSIVFSVVPAFIYILACPITFKLYREIAPSWKWIKKRYFGALVSLGGKFFVVQIAYLVVFMTSNLIISNLFGPQEVTPYNIAFKYFSVLTMGFTIVITPFWSAITEAYTLNDMMWIRTNIRNLVFVWAGFALLSIAMLIISPYVYSVWVGAEVEIPMSLSVFCAVYVSIVNWNNLFAYMINGIGKLHIQLILAVVQGILFVPLAIWCGKNFGVTGVLVALCLCLFISAIGNPIQCWKIVNKKATGVWNK